MLTQAKILEEKMADSGWRIVQRFERSDWWADEIWQLESVWSPIGASVWITFLVDPASDNPARKKGQNVWAVAASLERPEDRISQDFKYTMSLKNRWQKDLGNFIESLNQVREIV